VIDDHDYVVESAHALLVAPRRHLLDRFGQVGAEAFTAALILRKRYRKKINTTII
jgi:hypothetical protein